MNIPLLIYLIFLSYIPSIIYMFINYKEDNIIIITLIPIINIIVFVVFLHDIFIFFIKKFFIKKNYKIYNTTIKDIDPFNEEDWSDVYYNNNKFKKYVIKYKSDFSFLN